MADYIEENCRKFDIGDIVSIKDTMITEAEIVSYNRITVNHGGTWRYYLKHRTRFGDDSSIGRMENDLILVRKVLKIGCYVQVNEKCKIPKFIGMCGTIEKALENDSDRFEFSVRFSDFPSGLKFFSFELTETEDNSGLIEWLRV